MKKSLFTLILVSLLILSAYLLSCAPPPPPPATFAGTWLEMPDPGNGREKVTLTDSEFTEEKYDSSTTTYNKMMEGTYTYESSYATMNATKADPSKFSGKGDYGSLPLTYTKSSGTITVVLKSYSEGATTIVDADYTIMGQNAYTGGNTETLEGTWTSEKEKTRVTSTNGAADATFSKEETYQYIFDGSGGITYEASITTNGIMEGGIATGDVDINTTDKTFTVSNSSNTIYLANNIYTYKVIGDNIIISMYGTPCWFEKQ